jgi:Asp-tRNA(Asn)/Glu-tRNA(Gln) amidotransferase A subunit family amidase
LAAALRFGTGAGVSPVIGAAADIALQIAAGTRSAAAVLAECMALIQTKDPGLNCFTAKTFERAEREAAAIDDLYAE